MVNDGLSGGLYIYIISRYLVGGAVAILKNIFLRKNGKDDPIYEMESRKSHVPNHQPVTIQCIVGFSPNFSKKPIWRWISSASIYGNNCELYLVVIYSMLSMKFWATIKAISG